MSPQHNVKSRFELDIKPSFDDNRNRPPPSPRVRCRLLSAKEDAKAFDTVFEQSEVIHWMSVRSPELVKFGQILEKRGYNSLGSIAFLIEDDLDDSIDPILKKKLLAAVADLRHDMFRM